MTINFEPVKEYMNRTVPKIISIGMSVPPNSYTQEEVFKTLSYPRQYSVIFTQNGISKRHFWVPLGSDYSWQRMCEEYKAGALQLSVEAVRSCLDERSPNDVSCIVYTSCTGYQCPSMDYVIAKELNLPRNTEHLCIVGDGGCAGAAPAIRYAAKFTKLTGKMALAISTELSSVCYFPENPSPDPRGKFQLLRSNAIFGDGSSAILTGFDDNPLHPFIIDDETYTDYKHQDALGLEWREGRLSCILSSDVPELAPEALRKCIDPLLKRNGLQMTDIKWLICHPGGKKILDNVRDEFGLPETAMSLSREALRNFGNCSSTSVGLLSKLFMDNRATEIMWGDWGLILTVGSGMNANAILLKWGE